ncbi:MAG: DNA repair exonuclease [Thermoguttaceae bacterium]|nr:DNA repair exonuclease [Thermoguttaceae bacterium]MDW8037482.1 DNA repair exonuclease [Thermoguttaceae bacterium]
MRLIHTADLHLHPDHPERLEALEKICQLATDHGCSAILIAGDLFDRAEEALNERPKLRQLFDKYPFEVFIVAGNHDEHCYAPHHDYGQRVHLAAKKGLVRWNTKEGIEIWGLPFQRGSRAAEYLSQQSLPHQTPTVLLTHASFYHSDWLEICQKLQKYVQDTGGGDFAFFAPDLEGKGFAYVALGHWHNPTNPPLQIEGTLVAYAGTPCRVLPHELGRRQVILVELETTRINIQFLPVEGVPYYVEKRFFVAPGGEQNTLSQLAKFLQSQADPFAKAKLVVEGFLGWEESKFRAELENLRSQYAAQWGEVSMEHHWSHLAEAPARLVQTFIEQINAKTLEELQVLLNQFEPGTLYETARRWLQEAQEELKQEAICMGLRAIHQQKQRSRR